MLVKTGIKERSTTPGTPMMCAVVKQSERRSYGRSTLERGVVKQPPYLDLVTGEGVEHGGEGPNVETHTLRGGSS